MGRHDRDDWERLLEEVDELLLDGDEDEFGDEEQEDDFDPEEYAPARENDDVLMVYRNYSNGYGREIRNYSNGYGTGVREEPEREPAPVIPAYNADFRRAQREQEREFQKDRSRDRSEARPRKQEPTGAPEKTPKKRKKHGCCGCLLPVLLLLAAVAWYLGKL